MLKINKLNFIKTTLLAGTMALSMASCKKPIHQLESTNTNILELVDNFTNSEFNTSAIDGLDLYKIDTVEIKEKDFENPENLSNKLKNSAQLNNPQVLVKDEWEYGYGIGPRMTLKGAKVRGGFDYHQVQEYEDKYLKETVTAKAQNKVFANEYETKFYIPVEYYGKLDSTVVEVN